MKYIIEEEELNEHIFSKLTYWLKASSQLDDIIVNRGKCADDITESFLKSKTPVEEVGTGLIGETKNSILKSMEVVGIGMETPNYVCIKNVELPKLSTKDIGKKVKIYIEVIK